MGVAAKKVNPEDYILSVLSPEDRPPWDGGRGSGREEDDPRPVLLAAV